MVISNYFGQPELGADDSRDASLAPCSRDRSTQGSIGESIAHRSIQACNMLQALGIAYSKIVLPSSDSKGESKGRTYCPTTWNYSYTWQHAAEYADQLRQVGASALLCHECTLLVIAQLSKKSNNHPNCACADSAAQS